MSRHMGINDSLFVSTHDNIFLLAYFGAWQSGLALRQFDGIEWRKVEIPGVTDSANLVMESANIAIMNNAFTLSWSERDQNKNLAYSGVKYLNTGF